MGEPTIAFQSATRTVATSTCGIVWNFLRRAIKPTIRPEPILQIANKEPRIFPPINALMILYKAPEIAPTHGPIIAATMTVPIESR